MGGKHETFHDTINLLKRKPRRLTGTPARLYSVWLSLGSASLLTYLIFIYKDFNFVRAEREQILISCLPNQALEDQKRIMHDDFMRSAILNLRKKQEGELEPTPPHVDHPATF